MKKFLSVLLIAVLSIMALFTRVGCGDTPDNTGSKGISCIKEDGKYVVYKYVDDGNNVAELDIDKAVKAKYLPHTINNHVKEAEELGKAYALAHGNV